MLHESRRLTVILTAIAFVATSLTGTVVAEEVNIGAACVNATGDADCWGAAVSTMGDASGFLAVSATGNATAGYAAITGTGNATGHLPISITGHCRYNVLEPSRPCYGVSATDDTNGYYLAASLTGNASGDLMAVSGTGYAHSAKLAVSANQAGNCTPHPHIRITENEGPNGFIVGREPATGAPIYRSGSGVIAGNGTADDPYIIEGWCITPPAGQPLLTTPGILIQGTTAHVAVKNVALGVNNALFTRGIVIDHADNVVVENTLLMNNDWGAVLLYGSTDVRVVNNTITSNAVGIYSEDSRGLHITRNTITKNAHGVVVHYTTRVNVTGNTITENVKTSLSVSRSPLSLIQNNAISTSGSGGIGLSVGASNGTRITGNAVTNNKWSGVAIGGSSHVSFVANTVTGNDDHGAILRAGSTDAHIANNTMEANNGEDLYIVETRGAILRGNAFGSGGLVIRGTTLAAYQHDVDASNTVNNAPLRYIRNERGIDLEGPAGQVILVNTSASHLDGGTLSNVRIALHLAFTTNTTVTNASFTNNTHGILLDRSAGIQLTNNHISGSDQTSILLYRSEGTVLRGNTLTGGGLFVTGTGMDHYQHDVDASNTLHGEPIQYVRNEVNVEVTEPAGQVILVNTTNATVAGLHLSRASVGLTVAFARNTTISDNTFWGDGIAGVVHAVSSGTRFTQNKVTNKLVGIQLSRSSHVHISNNTLGDNVYGVRVLESSKTRIADNTITDNRRGGVELEFSSDSDITGNVFAHNGWGVVAAWSGARVVDNNFHNQDDYGLLVLGGDDPVGARGNWWGEASGPSGFVRDACTGVYAVGGGDGVFTWYGGEVCFDPWRTEPNPGAGAK